MNEINASVEEAMLEVLPEGSGPEGELSNRLRALIRNCLQDNYDQTDVRSCVNVILDQQTEA